MPRRRNIFATKKHEGHRADQHWCCLLTMLVLLFVVRASFAQQSSAAQQALSAQGVQALQDGRLDEAETLFLRLLRQGDKSAFVRHNLGIVYQQRGAHEKAIPQFRAAVQLQPAYGPAHLLLGVSLLAEGKTNDAADALEHAVRLLPEEPQARLQLAKAYERRNDWLGVVAQYQALSQLAPQEAEYAYQLGRAYSRLAEWSHQQIITVNPDAARLHQSLGQQYLIQGKYDLAVAEYQRAAQVDPQLPEIHLALAVIYLEQKRYDEANREIALELKLAPESNKALEIRKKIADARAAAPQ